MNILSKQNSTAMKGFFILLIIFGHCSLLGADWSHGIKYHVYSWYNYLYDFHVACFFILPFLYNKNTYKKGNIKKYAARLLVPFLLFCLICFLISLLYNKPINIYILPLALLTGSEYLLKNSIGFGYLWFLPAMFTLLLIKDFYYTSCRIIKIGVVLCCWQIHQ
jgi:fucose 4-O-acetylase-like acetyltransferase